jgi:oxamate amidohydrolase
MPETPVFSRAAVAAPHAAASAAGRAVLAEGGNAIEAMLAMAATIAVVYPHMNAIGGDGFWLVREPGGKVHAIEACGFAGAGATIARYREKGHERIPPRGPDAALTVPGAIGGWMRARELAEALGGRLPMPLLLSDAIRLAREGYAVSGSEAREEAKEWASLSIAPGFAQNLLHEGKLPPAGHQRRNLALAETLSHLAGAGLDDFYRGDVGREIAHDLEAIGSPVTRADLARYQAVWRKPLSMRWRDAMLYNVPPPTQGLVSLTLLGIFARLDVKLDDDFAYLHGLIEASKRAMALRDRVITDFDHLRVDPADYLQGRWLDAQALRISLRRAAPFPMQEEDGDTIWMGAIDASGLSVSYIQSIYWEYGSGCVLPRTGILMQNRGVAFSLDPSALNPLQPGRKPFHTLNPAMAVFDDGRVVSYGSMGGDGQPQFQAQVFTRWASRGETPAKALDAPRFLLGKTWGASSTTLKLENRFDDSLLRALSSAGHAVELMVKPYQDDFGHAGLLVKHPGNGRVEAAHDPRSDGGAEGL